MPSLRNETVTLSPSPIRDHVAMLHGAAKGVSGVLVVSVFHANPLGDKDTPGTVTHHSVGDVDGMVAAIEAGASVDHANVYVGLQVMRRGLARGKRGLESDIVAVLGLVADMDADTGKNTGTLPLDPTWVVETSPGNLQPAWLFDRPISPEDAKPLARALRRATESDAGTADITHVWRIPGTRNWPNAKKIARGRPSEPADVLLASAWEGDSIELAEMRAALFPWATAPATESPVFIGELPDVAGIIVSEKVDGLLSANGVDDRSKHAAQLVEAMAFEGHSAEESMVLFMAADGDWTERYKDEGSRSKDFERLWGKFGRKDYAQLDTALLGGKKLEAANDNGQAPKTVEAISGLDIFAWPASRFVGEPAPVEYLVDGVIESGIPGMVAAMGELGKSYSLLELCRRVAFGSSRLSSPIFGGQVVQEGTAVFLTGEDDERSIHRRIAAIDPKHARFAERGDKLIAIPLPSAVPVFQPFWTQEPGFKATDAWRRFEDQLSGIPDLRVVVIDPLQMFAALKINDDPGAGQFVCAQIAGLAAKTGANVFFAHHMKKASGKDRIASLADARDAIRGTSALVDGVRVAYALWYPEEAEGRAEAKAIGVDYQPNRIVHGGVVKANGAARRHMSTYSRNDSGLLVDRTAMTDTVGSTQGDLKSIMVVTVEAAAKAGQPFTKSGAPGLFSLRTRLPYELAELSRHRIESLCDACLVDGSIVACIGKGSSTAKWLDVPGGPFAIGLGEFRRGTTYAQQ